MSRSLLILAIILLIVTGCADVKDTMEYKGTVILKKDTSIILLDKKIEVHQQMGLEEILLKYGGNDQVLEFSMDNKELEKVDIGDYVIVFSNGNFDDLEPPKGFAERVKVEPQ